VKHRIVTSLLVVVVLLGSTIVSNAQPVNPHGLRVTDVEATGGLQPISVTEHDGVVYVVHAGSDSIAGFALGRNGRLRPIENSTRSLSGSGVGPAEIAFTPDGRFLVVTEKNTNRILTFTVDSDGLAGAAQVQNASGTTPFGFAFGLHDQLFVTEAFGGALNASATSACEIDADGTLTTLSASVATGQTAACWAAVTPDGRFVYVTNTGSSSITGYAIHGNGEIELLDQDGRTGVTGGGSTPIDVAIAGGRYLYNLNSGSHAIGQLPYRGKRRVDAVAVRDRSAGRGEWSGGALNRHSRRGWQHEQTRIRGHRRYRISGHHRSIVVLAIDRRGR